MTKTKEKWTRGSVPRGEGETGKKRRLGRGGQGEGGEEGGKGGWKEEERVETDEGGSQRGEEGRK